MPVSPAALGESPSGHAPGVPYSPLYDDVYHAVAGAWAQARHVFMGGNGLPGRWEGRSRFVILETGFGLGNNFLATWAAWERDAGRCDQLVFISIEKHPLRREDMARVHDTERARAPSDQDEADRHRLGQRLVQAWPVLTPGLHSLYFALQPGMADAHPGGQRVTLMLGLGDIADLLPAIMAQVDAFYLDGFAPAKNPDMWDERLLSRLNRLAAPGCTAATWSAARGVRDALGQAGFTVERVPGFAGKRDMVRASYAPRYTAPPLAGGMWPEASQAHRHAIVLGAGLAGCAVSLALRRQGWRVTLIDQHGGPASEASGNPGGLFHSVLHAEDGIHARAHRAAALATWRLAEPWIRAGRLPGQAKGLLRLDGKTSTEDAQALLDRQGLPEDHVQWLDQSAAQLVAGLSVSSGGWLFHQAGWLDPAALARLMLEDASALPPADGTSSPLTCLWGRHATGLSPTPDGQWQVHDGEAVIAQAPTLVLCCASQTTALLGTLPADQAVAELPLSSVRGQLTELIAPSRHGVTLPHIPVAGSGYVLPMLSGALLCGATTQHHDADAAVRDADHRHNLLQAARLGTGLTTDAIDSMPSSELRGRTAWRATTPDRLPLVGALPWSLERLTSVDGPRRLDQIRLLPRERSEKGGLYLLTGLGSRGITWSCLAAELLAHWVTGAPCPVETDLRDALDPARFLVRRMTRQGGKQ